jgi:hypothetical protein
MINCTQIFVFIADLEGEGYDGAQSQRDWLGFEALNTLPKRVLEG